MLQINQIQKRKSVMQTKNLLTLVNLFKKEIIMLKLLEYLHTQKIHSISGLATTTALNAVGN